MYLRAIFQEGIFEELRVDVKEDWHVDLFAGIQPLLLETEALDLVEIRPGLEGDHVVRADAVDRFLGGIFRLEKGNKFRNDNCRV